jgi:hypothetical protein
MNKIAKENFENNSDYILLKTHPIQKYTGKL